MKTYIENFDNGAGGWHAWKSNREGPGNLDIRDGAVVCRSPWWVDYNHAPPHGKGYLHILMCLRTHAKPSSAHAAEVAAAGGTNRFVSEGHCTDFRNAKVTVRLRGEMDLQRAHLSFHVQSQVEGRWLNFVLTGRPFTVTRDWSEQSVVLEPDPAIWTSLGTRHDRADFYGGEGAIEDVLRDLNGNMILVLFPLNVVPSVLLKDPADIHRLRAGEEFEVDRSQLPTGFVMIDWIRIEKAQ